MKVYGECGEKQYAGSHWSAIDNSKWKFLVCWRRVWNYSYRVRFDEDWRADIDIRFCCTLSGKTWCSYPHSYTAFDMVKTKHSKNGSQLDRRKTTHGGPMQNLYVLEDVYKYDGSPTDYVESFNLAPETMILSRWISPRVYYQFWSYIYGEVVHCCISQVCMFASEERSSGAVYICI